MVGDYSRREENQNPLMRVINDNGEPFMPTLKLVANGTIGGI